MSDNPDSAAPDTVSRWDFLAATAAGGIALGAGASVSALAQPSPGSPRRPLHRTRPPGPSRPPNAFEMYEGTAAGAVLAQLRAAGVRMLFHTNTSGFVPF